MKLTNLDLTAELLWQDPNESATHLYRILRRHLSSPEIVGCRVASAYASWGGLSLVSTALEAFLTRGKRLQTIFGTGNAITTPDALLYALYLKKKYPDFQNARTFEWRFGNSEFHPKYYEFQYPDRLVTVIGSSNFTGGGLAMNHELSVAVTSTVDSAMSRSCEAGWSRLWNKSKVITPERIRSLSKARELGSERDRARLGDKPQFIGVKLPRAKKPLFRYLLEEESVPQVKHEVLAAADSLTEKPAQLFLQILEYETGGGYQIQLPVATLGAFFGVGKGESKDVTFRFPSISENINVQLTHFGNNTHRVRLLPLREVPRPAIVVFEQGLEDGTYDCRVIGATKYERTLRDRCTEQTREGSRRWGLQQ